ncbi:MAG: hypothetical protein JEZ00_08175 [Anaerolineaceae bacterium]|nr:hypothetical protein [Anaerolineaceae bacterium]
MTTSEERLKILTMIQEGKISAEEGLELLNTLSTMGSEANQAQESGSFRKSARWLRVRVTDTNTEKTLVNVRLPISLMNAGMKMGAKFAPEIDGVDMNLITSAIRDGEIGKIVDVFDEKDGEHVEVFLD